MTDVSIKGPATDKLLSRLAINIFNGFGAMQAKQFVAWETLAQKPQHRKVRLTWNAEDMTEIMASGLSDGNRYKYLNAPSSNQSTYSLDEVLLDGQRVGVSIYPVYPAEELWRGS